MQKIERKKQKTVWFVSNPSAKFAPAESPSEGMAQGIDSRPNPQYPQQFLDIRKDPPLDHPPKCTGPQTEENRQTTGNRCFLQALPYWHHYPEENGQRRNN